MAEAPTTPAAPAAEPPNADGEEGEEGEEGQGKPEEETEEEKMERIRAVKFPVIPHMQQILQKTFPLFIRKGAKKKTELQEKLGVAPMLRSLAFNPTDEQVEKLATNVCMFLSQYASIPKGELINWMIG